MNNLKALAWSFGASLLAASIMVTIITWVRVESEDRQFTEIHGTETNDCWCPDECDINGELKWKQYTK